MSYYFLNGIVGAVVGFLLLMPLLTFFHELGHVTPSLILGHKAEIILGNAERSRELEVGRLKINVEPFSFGVGFAKWDVNSGKSLQLASLISGPLVSLAIFVFLYLIKSHEFSFLAQFLIGFAMYFSLCQFIMTIIPMHYPSFMGSYDGMASDGRQALELLGFFKGNG